jgi:hypothetical protein
MTTIEETRKEMREYEKIRTEFYDFFDKNLAKTKNGQYDFENSKDLDPKEVYEHFFKLDYQARKLRGLLMEARGIEPK